MLLNNRPLLFYTLSIFYKFDSKIRIILVLPKNFINEWKNLCSTYNYPIKHKIVEGGNTRYFSVKNGLENIDDDGLVAIHDGVRPLVSLSTIQNAFDTAKSFGSAVPVVEVNESVRELTEAGNQVVDRKKLRLIQTPQVFQAAEIKKAYQKSYQHHFTDDASVYEMSGETIYLSEGNWENIKITRQADLVFAESILKTQ